jgi:phage gpG-like protein
MDLDEAVRVAIEAVNKLEADLIAEPYESALSQCREHLRENFVQIFAQKASSDGSSWPPHSPVTESLWGPHPLLILSGDLYGQLTEDATIGERSVTVGTDLFYADYNNNPSEDSNIPKREFMYLTEETQVACVERIGERVFELLPGEIVE